MSESRLISNGATSFTALMLVRHLMIWLVAREVISQEDATVIVGLTLDVVTDSLKKARLENDFDNIVKYEDVSILLNQTLRLIQEPDSSDDEPFLRLLR